MEDKEIHYSNEDITVVWRPKLCQHSGVCIRMLPKVYNPSERPWVKVEHATSEELIHQVSKCPSGALSHVKKEKTNK